MARNNPVEALVHALVAELKWHDFVIDLRGDFRLRELLRKLWDAA